MRRTKQPRMVVSDEHLPAKRSVQGRVLERTGVATGAEVDGIQVGILAKDLEALELVCGRLGVTVDPDNVSPAAWMRSQG